MKGKTKIDEQEDNFSSRDEASIAKSLVRVKLYGCIVVGIFGMFLASFSPQFSLFYWVGFSIAAVCAILQFGIKCENCGNLAYRLKSKTDGVPHPLYIFQPRRCPLCGVERY